MTTRTHWLVIGLLMLTGCPPSKEDGPTPGDEHDGAAQPEGQETGTGSESGKPEI